MQKNNYRIWGLFYSNPDDSRFFVPRFLGWTINFSHPKSRMFLAVLMISLLFGQITVVAIINRSYLVNNLNVIFWYLLAISGSLIVFYLNFSDVKLDVSGIKTVLSFGILSSFIGFGLQQIFNGLPVLLIWGLNNLKWYHHLYLGPVAGLCQSVAKLLIIALLVKINHAEDKNKIVAFGLLVGLGFTISEITFIASKIIYAKLPQVSYIGIWERIASSIFHIYSGGLLALGIFLKKYIPIISVLIIHSVLDFIAGLYGMYKFPIIPTEIVFSLISVFVWILYLRYYYEKV